MTIERAACLVDLENVDTIPIFRALMSASFRRRMLHHNGRVSGDHVSPNIETVRAERAQRLGPGFRLAFALARIFQSLVHLTNNNPSARGAFFSLSVLSVMALWVDLAVAVISYL